MLSLVFQLLKPSIAKAAPLFQGLNGAPIDDASAVSKLLKNAQLFLSTIAGIAAVGVIIWGATLYIIAGGESARLENAKKILTFGVLGLVLILGANVLATFMVFLLGGGDWVYDIVSDFAIISNNLTATAFGTKVLLFVAITGLLVFKSETSGLDTGSSLSKVQTGLYGFLGAGLALSSIFSYMTEAQRVALDSNFVNIVYGYYPVWVAAPVVLMLISPYLKR